MECAHAHIVCPPFWSLHLIFCPCPLGHLFKKNSIHGKQLSQYLVPSKKNLRSANWVAPTCPQGSPPPRGAGGGGPGGLDFPSSSQKVPIKFLLFPSITHQYAFGFIKFPNNSCQLPLVPINNLSKSFVLMKFSSNPFCQHQVLIKILLFPQLPFVPSTSFCSQPKPTQPNPTQHKPTKSSKFCERLGQSAKRSAPVPGQARKRSYSVTGRRLSGAAEQKVGILCLSGFVEDRGLICFQRGRLPRFFLHVRVLS